MSTEFKVPELGEGVESASVAKILVSAGDTVEVDQPVVELETDKAAAEVPCDIAGTVEKVHVEEGDDVAVGDTLLTISAEEEAEESADAESKEEPEEQEEQEPEEEEAAEEKTEDEEPEEEEEKPEKEEEEAPKKKGKKKPAAAEKGKEKGKPAKESEGEPAPAAPSVRRFAREIGVDIDRVEGSGPDGRISMDDVKEYARAERKQTGPAQTGAQELPDFTQWGDVTREEMSKVRRLTAERMVQAWTAVPQVTQFDKADITALGKLRREYREQAEDTKGKLTLTAVLVKIVGRALRAFPRFNASVDMAEKEIILKHYVNVGIAADTDRGLVVPVLRDVDRKSVVQLSEELDDLVQKARDGKLSVEDMRGGNFTISNAGVLGGGAFTPIVNWPESAILGVGQARTEAILVDEEFEPRQMLPLGLSYDHRLIDGADAVRFLRWIVEALESPMKLIWEG